MEYNKQSYADKRYTQMFEKCITCERLGEDCMPNLLRLPFPDLLKWWAARQKALGWTNQVLSEHSNIPKGTIDRIKQGEYDDCRYSTIRNILVALIGGVADEFPCKERMIMQQKRLEEVERENEALRQRLENTDALHRADVHAICEEYKEEIKFLKDVIRGLQAHKQ